MKRVITILLSAVMLVSVCLAATGCNNEKAAPAEEVFFYPACGDIAASILTSMGFEGKLALFAPNAEADKNVKLDGSLAVNNINLSGTELLKAPLTASVSTLSSASIFPVTGTVNYSYAADKLSAALAADREKYYLKLDGLFDKYVDFSEMTGQITDELFDYMDSSLMNDIMNDVLAAIKGGVNAEKLVETQQEITVNGVTAKVRAIEYTLKGDEIADYIIAVVDSLNQSKALATLLEQLGEDGISVDRNDLQTSENDTVTIVRYFDVNSPKGFDISMSFEDEAELVTTDSEEIVVNINLGYREVSNKNGVYGVGSFKVNDSSDICEATADIKSEGDSFLVNINATLSSSVTGSQQTTVTASVSGKTEDKDGAKNTKIELTAGANGVSIAIPMELTVKETSDSDKAAISVDFSFNALNTVSASVSLAYSIELTSDAPVMPAKDEIAEDIYSAINGNPDEFIASLSDTVELIETISEMFGGGTPEWDEDWDEDWDDDWDDDWGEGWDVDLGDDCK